MIEGGQGMKRVGGAKARGALHKGWHCLDWWWEGQRLSTYGCCEERAAYTVSNGLFYLH